LPLDLGRELGVVGEIIDGIAGIPLDGGAEVRMSLRSGKHVTVRDLDDHTDYYTT